MSAFIVNEYHISQLIKYGSFRDASMCVKGKFDRSINGNEQALMAMLVNANFESVNHRYKENTPPMPGEYCPDFDRVLSPIQVIKACDCYDYQSCEIESYSTSDAAKTIDSIRGMAISKLQGYEDVEWEIKERPINKNIVRII